MIADPERNRPAGLIRSFLAIPLAPDTLDTIETIQNRLHPELPEFRWTRRENSHLTLQFFGDITEEDLEKAGEIVVSVGSLFAPFSIRLTEIGAFPSPDRARLVWVGVESDRLGELYDALQTALQAAGFPIDQRRFRPHITIGRCKRLARHILSRRPITVAAEMRVDELILYESRLQASGAQHRPRQTIRLAEPGRNR